MAASETLAGFDILPDDYNSETDKPLTRRRSIIQAARGILIGYGYVWLCFLYFLVILRLEGESRILALFLRNPVITAVILFIVVILARAFTKWSNQKVEARRRELRLIAKQMHAHLKKSGVFSFFSLPQFRDFDFGDDYTLENILIGQANGIDWRFFDFKYTTGSGDKIKSYTQSTFCVESNSLELPEFDLRPKGGLQGNFRNRKHSRANAAKIEDKWNVHRSFALRGFDQEAILKFFNQEMISFFEDRPDLCADATRHVILIYRKDMTCATTEIEGFIRSGLELVRLLQPGRPALPANAG